ncbi:type II toxin-antitoxin system RelE/ParE family toxin [Tunturiibacter empetritectus]
MPRAERDLEAIFLYIQAESTPPADKWFRGLVEALESLAHHSQRNPIIAEDRTLRHLLYGNKPHIYRVIYSIDVSNAEVNVVHVRHRARNTFEPFDSDQQT